MLTVFYLIYLVEMRIKKIGHCCLVVEVNGKRIMTDPGNYSTGQVEEKNIDLVLITHEHADHLHVESLKKVLENNPGCKVITNSSVNKILDLHGIASEVLEEGEGESAGIKLFAKSCPHADIYDGVPVVQNTSYTIEDKLFYPGDAYLLPSLRPEVLALPVAGGWNRIRNFADYALQVRPKIIFNMHDGNLNHLAMNSNKKIMEKIFASKGMDYRHLFDGDVLEV